MPLFPDIVRAPVEVAPGYTLPADVAARHGWTDSEETLYGRIMNGIAYCRTHDAQEAHDARDLLCILCLVYSERFDGLPADVAAQLDALTETDVEKC